MDICTSLALLIQVTKYTRHAHVPIAPSDRKHHHAILGHVIMSESKCFVIYRRDAQCDEALCGADATSFSQRLASVKPAVF